MSLTPTASQTVGPFFEIGLQHLYRNYLSPAHFSGEPLSILGRVLDGDAQPVPDAVLEIWQVDSQGRVHLAEDARASSIECGPRGFARVPLDESGTFRFTTIKPGPVPGPEGALQAPHLDVFVFARGLLKPLLTRLYFPDEPGNASDVVLNLITAERRATLIPKPLTQLPVILEWNIVLQGIAETVFFDW